jgi:hypothetical protein
MCVCVVGGGLKVGKKESNKPAKLHSCRINRETFTVATMLTNHLDNLQRVYQWLGQQANSSNGYYLDMVQY